MSLKPVSSLTIADLVPGGVLPSDHVHHKTNDNTCSRCRWTVPDEDVPVMLWIGEDLLIYCETCLSMPSDGCEAKGRLTDEEGAGHA